MNLFNIKKEITTTIDGHKLQWYWSIGIICNKKPIWKLFTEYWYDGPIYILNLGFFSIGIVETNEPLK